MSPHHDPGLARLVASLAITGFDGTQPPAWLLRRLDAGLRGVCWFAQNVVDAQQARALADRLHSVSPGVLVMSDEEGGDVTRLEAATGSSWPGHAALGALDDVVATRAVAAGMGEQLRSAGVDVALAPVVDVNADPDNPVIGVRSFGSTSELVSRHAVAFVQGLQSAGVAACAKHFPGHGSTTVDSHLDLPRVDDPEELLRTRDLSPFAAAVRAGVRCVMSAHVVFPAFDAAPATLSGILLGLLRDELGFDGVIITDALDMKAISEGVGHGEGAIRALLAGADLLCIGNPSYPAAYDAEARLDLVVSAVARAVAEGRLPAERLERAADRVETLCRWIAEPRVSSGSADTVIGAEVAARTVRHRGAVAVRAPVVVDVVGAVNLAAGRRDRHLSDAIRRRDPGATALEVADGDAVATALATATGRDLVILVRTPRDATTRALVERVLAARADAVLVQTGLADPDVTSDRLVWTHGGGRAVAQATADLLIPVPLPEATR